MCASNFVGCWITEYQFITGSYVASSFSYMCRRVRCSVLGSAFEMENNHQQKRASTVILLLGIFRGSLDLPFLPLTLVGHQTQLVGPLLLYSGTSREFDLIQTPFKCVSLTGFVQWVGATYGNVPLSLW